MSGQRAGMGGSTSNALFDLARIEYNKAAGEDISKQGIFDDIDMMIESIKAVQAQGKDPSDFLVDFFKNVKRGFMGLNFNPSDKDAVKAIEGIRRIAAQDGAPKEETDRFNFWAGLLSMLVENRKKESRSTWR